MTPQTVASLACPQCQTEFQVPVEQIVDAQSNPEAKSRLLDGQLNFAVCPRCGFAAGLNVPFLYHDADLELALVYMPMDLNMSETQRQKAIGDLTNLLMKQLPPDKRKGYLFQPRVFLSLKGLVDAILESDEESRAFVERRQRMGELFNQVMQLDLDDTLAVAAFVSEHDDELDELFIEMLRLFASLMERGSAEYARISGLVDMLMDKTSAGQRLRAIDEALEVLRTNPSREVLLEQLIEASEPAVRWALVSAGRDLLDYRFFQMLTARIEAAKAAGDRETEEALLALRSEVMESRERADEMLKLIAEERANAIREMMVADDLAEAVRRHAELIDPLFFEVLDDMLRGARLRGQNQVVQVLQLIGATAMTTVRQMMPPPARLLVRLLGAEDQEEVQNILEQERELMTSEFLEMVEEARADYEGRGDEAMVARLRYIAEQVKQAMAA